MNEAAPAIFVALEGSALGAAIRQSTWAYMAANVGHIVALVVFVASVAVLDLRLIGAFAATPPGRIITAARRGTVIGIIGLVITGAVLFTAEASHVILNPVFQFKLGLIALGLINVALFEYFTAPKVRDLPALAPMPSAARTAGMISLAVWITVAAFGRSIAYF